MHSVCSSGWHTSFFSQLNIFIHYLHAAVTLTPHTKLTRAAEKDRLLPRLALAKRSSLTSENAVLPDWIRLPVHSFVRARQKPRERGREMWRQVPGKLCSARCSHPQKRDKRKRPGVQGSESCSPSSSSPHPFSLARSPAWHIYRQLPDPQATNTAAKWTKSPPKSHLLRRSKAKKMRRQPVF